MRLADALFRGVRALRDGGLGAEKRARDLGGVEAAQRLEREGDLRVLRHQRVAAGEDHAQAVILDFDFVETGSPVSVGSRKAAIWASL